MPMTQQVTRSCGKQVEPYTVTFTTDNTWTDDMGEVKPGSVVWAMATACHIDSPEIASSGAELPADTKAHASGSVVGLCPHEYNLLTTGRVNPTMDVSVSPRWHFMVSPAPQA